MMHVRDDAYRRAEEGPEPVPFVRAYVKKDGTAVSAHTRSSAGARKELARAACCVAVVLAFGAQGAEGGSGGYVQPDAGARVSESVREGGSPSQGGAQATRARPGPAEGPGERAGASTTPGSGVPMPRSTVVYPIKWPGHDRPVPRPSATASYPIVHSGVGGDR